MDMLLVDCGMMSVAYLILISSFWGVSFVQERCITALAVRNRVCDLQW